MMFIWSCSIDYGYKRRNSEVRKLRSDVKSLKDDIKEEEIFYKAIINNYEFSYFIIKKKKLGYEVDVVKEKKEDVKKKQSMSIFGRIRNIFRKDKSAVVKMIEPMKLTEKDGVLTGSVVPVQIFV
jgi:hypothetical protein